MQICGSEFLQKSRENVLVESSKLSTIVILYFLWLNFAYIKLSNYLN